MNNSTVRHWVVALGLVAVAGITGASAAGFVTHARHGAPVAAPVVSGDLGEVVIVAPADLGEVVVHAPHDLGDVMVEARRTGPAPAYLAEVVVTAPRDVLASAATLVAAR